MKFKSPEHKLIAVAEDYLYAGKNDSELILSALQSTCDIYGWDYDPRALLLLIMDARENYIKGKHTKFLSLF